MNLPSLPIFMILVGICLCGILLGYIIADGLYRIFSSVIINFTFIKLLGMLGLIGFVLIVVGFCLWLWKAEL